MVYKKIHNRFINSYKKLSEVIEKVIFKPNTIAKNFNLPSDNIYLWGKKKSGIFRELIAKLQSRKIVFLEDGFIRSINYGSREEPFSICIDKKNIFYDNSCSNDLENYITKSLDKTCTDRAKNLKYLWIKSRISKYNCELESEPPKEPLYY